MGGVRSPEAPAGDPGGAVIRAGEEMAMQTETSICPGCGEQLDWRSDAIAIQYSTLDGEPDRMVLMHAACAATRPNIRVNRSDH